MMTFRAVLLLMLFSCHLISCAASKASDGGVLSPTIYYKPTIHLDRSKCDESEMTEMRSPEDKLLATMCKADFARCVMQGSCFVASGERLRSFNYYARGADTIPRFTEVDLKKCPYGYGFHNTCLDPYFTVAADLKVYKLGDVIFVPRLVGIQMPDGETHDGFLIVRDVGAGVQGANRFDFFTGFYNYVDRENVMARLGFGDRGNAFEFRLATEEEAAATRERRGYPGLRKVVVRPGAAESGPSVARQVHRTAAD